MKYHKFKKVFKISCLAFLMHFFYPHSKTYSASEMCLVSALCARRGAGIQKSRLPQGKFPWTFGKGECVCFSWPDNPKLGTAPFFSSRLLFPMFFLMHWDEAMEVQQLILCWLRKIGVGHRWNKKLFLLPQNKSHGAHRTKPGCLSWFTSEDWSALAKFSLNIPGWFSGLTCWKPAEPKGEGHLGTSENVML